MVYNLKSQEIKMYEIEIMFKNPLRRYEEKKVVYLSSVDRLNNGGWESLEEGIKWELKSRLLNRTINHYIVFI